MIVATGAGSYKTKIMGEKAPRCKKKTATGKKKKIAVNIYAVLVQDNQEFCPYKSKSKLCDPNFFLFFLRTSEPKLFRPCSEVQQKTVAMNITNKNLAWLKTGDLFWQTSILLSILCMQVFSSQYNYTSP